MDITDDFRLTIYDREEPLRIAALENEEIQGISQPCEEIWPITSPQSLQIPLEPPFPSTI